MSKGAVRTLTLLALTCAMMLAYAYRPHWDMAALAPWLAEVRPAASLMFIGLYAPATVLFMPGSVLALAGGALLGAPG